MRKINHLLFGLKPSDGKPQSGIMINLAFYVCSSSNILYNKQVVAKQDSPVLFLKLNLYFVYVYASISVSSHCDMEVLVITRPEWPLKGHGGLTIRLFQREESVTLQYVHHRHGFSSGVIVLMDENILF